MPGYEYAIFGTGERELARTTVFLPIGERDGVALRILENETQLIRVSSGELLAEFLGEFPKDARLEREQLPRTLTVSGSAQDPEEGAGLDGISPNMQRCFYKEEQRLGADFENVAGFSKQEIRDIWAEPAAGEQKQLEEAA